MVEAAPIHEVEVEVVEHVRRIKDLLWCIHHRPCIRRPRLRYEI